MQVSDGFNAVADEFTVRLEDVDDTDPTVSQVAITSDPGADRTYAADDEIQVTVTFSETVEVEGTPQLRLEFGGRTRTATYEGGTGTAGLVFAYEVAEGESDTDGVGVEADSLSGGTIEDEADNPAELDHDGLAADANHKVDAVKPRLAASGGAVVERGGADPDLRRATRRELNAHCGRLHRVGRRPDEDFYRSSSEREHNGTDARSGGRARGGGDPG